MPTTARVVLPAYPHHVVQRGHNRQAVFAANRDYQRYLATLAEFKEVFGVKLYAWCLMTNHVHLLLEPSTATALGMLMKRVSARQTRYRNHVERRSGTLWEGRQIKSCANRRLPPGLLPLHRNQSSARGHGGSSAGLPVVELPGPARICQRQHPRSRSLL